MEIVRFGAADAFNVLGVESNHTRIKTAFLLADHYQLQAHYLINQVSSSILRAVIAKVPYIAGRPRTYIPLWLAN